MLSQLCLCECGIGFNDCDVFTYGNVSLYVCVIDTTIIKLLRVSSLRLIHISQGKTKEEEEEEWLNHFVCVYVWETVCVDDNNARSDFKN